MGVSVSPSSGYYLPGQTDQCAATAQYQDCNGISTYSTVTGSATWSSNNTAVATVNNSTSKGLVTAVSGGTATVSGMYSSYTYTFSTLTGCHANTAQRTGSMTCNVLTATITVHFTGSKTAGDNLTFPSNRTCSQSLGLFNCPSQGTWVWNVEVQANVSDDASKWTTKQSFTGRKKGYYKDSTGNLVSFDNTLNFPNDDPGSSFVQQPSGQKVIFWLDVPGHGYKYDNGQPIDSITQVENFTSKVCSTQNSSACASVNWYFKLVVNPGKALDTTNSKAGLGTASTNF